MLENIRKLIDIGAALSHEENETKLMEMIVDVGRMCTNSDGGTLYIKSEDGRTLRFAIIQTRSLNIFMGGSREKITWPDINLFNEDNTENHTNVSSHVALTGKTIDIKDVYTAKGFDFSGTKAFDQQTNYRSKSMLVVPLKDHENEIIGVIQLINSQDIKTGSVIPFSTESQKITESLSSQAAVVLTKNKLLKGLEELFNSFLRTIAKAIDEKSHYTSGHINRVTEITMKIANRINEENSGRFSSVKFSNDELNELRIAAWMHDIGKITTPEYIIDKATKLETIYDRISEIETRFELFKKDAEIKLLNKKLELIKGGKEKEIITHEEEYQKEIAEIDNAFALISEVNKGAEAMSDNNIQRVKDLAKNMWERRGKKEPWLSENEVTNLTIIRGTLTHEERDIIQNHASLTESMLKELPFPKKLKNVQKYACCHHETLAGTGYPNKLKGSEIPLQGRIIAFADIFEALSASDRPYKTGKTTSEVINIIGNMVKHQNLDGDIANMFLNDKIFFDYVKENFNPNQIDIEMDCT